jgi:hypothetical protein
LRTPVLRAIRTAGLTPMPSVAEDLGGRGGTFHKLDKSQHEVLG